MLEFIVHNLQFTIYSSQCTIIRVELWSLTRGDPSTSSGRQHRNRHFDGRGEIYSLTMDKNNNNDN